jgi:hypothetical protein
MILRVGSCVISAFAAIPIFALSLVGYAEAVTGWARGEPDYFSLPVAIFLSVSAIGIVWIQSDIERRSKIARIIGGLLGAMGSLALAFFTVFFFRPVHHPDIPEVLSSTLFAIATLITGLRARYAVKVALRP